MLRRAVGGIIAVLLLILTTSLLAQNQTRGGGDPFEEGRRLFEDRFYSEASRSLTDFVARHPGDPRSALALYMTGVSYFYLKDYTNSLKVLFRLRQRYPRFPHLSRASYWMGAAHFKMEAYRESITLLSPLLSDELSPYRDRVRYYLGRSYEKVGDLDRAKNLYTLLAERERFTGPLKAEVLFRLGGMTLKEKRYREAHHHFSKIVLDHPETAFAKEALYFSGESLFLIKEYPKAAKRFSSFLLHYPHSPYREPALYRLGFIALEANRPKEAASRFASLLKEFPEGKLAKEAGKTMGEVSFRSGDYAQAIRAYQSLLRSTKNPKERQKLSYNLGRSFSEGGDLPRAIIHFVEASRGPDPAIRYRSLYQAGLLEKRQGNLQGEISYNRILFSSKKDNPFREEAGVRLLTLYQARGEKSLWKNVILTLIKEYSHSPQHDKYRLLLGNAALEEGKMGEALSQFQWVRKNAGAKELRAQALLNIGYIYSRRKEFVRAYEYYAHILEEGEEVSPSYDHALYAASLCLMNAGKIQEAFTHFSRLVERSPQGKYAGEAYFHMGHLRYREHLYDQAEALFQKATLYLANEKRQARAHYWRGWSLFQRNAYQEAASAFLKAGEQDSSFHESLYRAALSQRAAGHLEESLPFFDRALRGASSLRGEILYEKGWTYFLLGQSQKALDTVKTMAEDHPPQKTFASELLFRIGESFFEERKYKEAHLWFSWCAETFPSQKSAELSLLRSGIALARTGAVEHAAEILIRFVKKYPQSEDISVAMRSLGNLILMATSPALAESLYSRAKDLPVATLEMAPLTLAYLKRSQDTPAKLHGLQEIYRLAVTPYQKHHALLSIGRYHVRQQDYQLARDILEELSKDSHAGTEGATAQYIFANSFERQRETRRAAEEYMHLVYRFPSQWKIRKEALIRARHLYEKLGATGEVKTIDDLLLLRPPSSSP